MRRAGEVSADPTGAPTMTERNEHTSKTISSNAAKLIHITAEDLRQTALQAGKV